MLKTLDRYILKNFLKNFLIGLLGFLGVYFAVEILPDVIRGLISNKITIYEAALLSVAGIPKLISFEIIHIAALIGSLWTMNNMSRNMETVVLKSSGVSFKRIILAPLILSLLLAGMLILFTNNIVTKSEKTSRSITQKFNYVDLGRLKYTVSMRGKNNILYHIYRVDADSNVALYLNIVMMDDKFTKIKKIITAESAVFDPKTKDWIMFRVNVNDIESGSTEYLETMKPDFYMNNIEDFVKVKVTIPEELTFKEIKEELKLSKDTGSDTTELELHFYYKRIAFPLAIVIMCLLGFALNSRFSRGGNSSHIVISIVLGFSYYIVAEISIAYGIGHVLPIILSAWIPNIIFLVMGLYFLINSEY